ncbi:riboflavin biosynthesis protein RibF [Thermoanaerobacter kivui]|uniref:Riboflavin biosynthesis protein n=1 Tax=Thermoanaerobacter kivui TaxID=2325 RepID=A0A097ARP7_THEKI|nr:bifunctional riboflavin kinase/FAD synthetase [Thermoanaerobacter kivui]AIS52477.1 riboflavin biosynthesis protein RibF [Thermoanaerobacter kivui]
MQVIDETNILQFDDYKGIALGNFDGIHLGHQELIKRAISLSQSHNLKSAVFTFKQHTLEILSPNQKPELIMSQQKKLEVLKQFSLDYGIFFNFSREFSQLTPEEFVKKVLVEKLKAKIIVVGYNYRFGYKALGNMESLQKYSKVYYFEVHVVPPVTLEGVVVSSSYIRQLIKSGEIERANKFLGRFFSLEGEVVHGREVGRKLGFPTANLQIKDNIVLPKTGVYVTRVKVMDKLYLGVTNIGFKPTFEGKDVSIESYLLDCNENLYGKHIEVEFVKRIRDEIKFDSIGDLKKQVFKDINYAKKFKNILQEKLYMIK